MRGFHQRQEIGRRAKEVQTAGIGERPGTRHVAALVQVPGAPSKGRQSCAVMPISGNAAAKAKIAASPSSATAVHRAANSTSAVLLAGRPGTGHLQRVGSRVGNGRLGAVGNLLFRGRLHVLRGITAQSVDFRNTKARPQPQDRGTFTYTILT